MRKKPKLLIASTRGDLSLSLFKDTEAARFIEPHVVMYDGEIDLDVDYSYVYFHDPFNDGSLSQDRAQEVAARVVSRLGSCYFVDGISSYQDMLFGDKWLQYARLSEDMPQTELLISTDGIDYHKYFVKKRISSRAKGVIFSKDDFPDGAVASDYIVQPKLDISIEYRVFMVGGRVILPLAIKSSKRTDQKVKVIGVTSNIDPNLKELCDRVYALTNYDFMGLDIAKDGDRYYLLEVNRSCQFQGYLRTSSINLATTLSKYLLTKHDPNS